jgi:hypothetical protein
MAGQVSQYESRATNRGPSPEMIRSHAAQIVERSAGVDPGNSDVPVLVLTISSRSRIHDQKSPVLAVTPSHATNCPAPISVLSDQRRTKSTDLVPHVMRAPYAGRSCQRFFGRDMLDHWRRDEQPTISGLDLLFHDIRSVPVRLIAAPAFCSKATAPSSENLFCPR